MHPPDAIRSALSRALSSFGVDVPEESVILEHPADLAHGDYASGAALRHAKAAGMAPRELAEKLKESMGDVDGVESVQIAGPGFLNFALSSQAIARLLEAARSEEWGSVESMKKEVVMVEYGQPNPFKEFHVGHLMGTVIGESLARLFILNGARVIRVNYQGDVGVHVACAIWGMLKLSLDPASADEFGGAYAAGAKAYKEDPAAKLEIDEINQKLYARSDEALNALYDAGRARSLNAFEHIYGLLGTRYDHYFFESATGPLGKEIVEAHPDLFPESDGARVFKGEDYGLHTRVFLNAKHLPTYEAKELGLETLKKELYPQTTRLLVETAKEIDEYFKVVKRALSLISPEIADELEHVSHGLMRLPEGKMSSRTGAVVTGESLLNDLVEAAHARASQSRAKDKDALAREIAVAAIKYQILRQDVAKDTVFDREKALSLEGDSGPYLQYAYARACAIVEKAAQGGVSAEIDESAPANELSRLLYRLPEVVERAASERAPHHVATLLIEVAGAFNSWYSQVPILDGTGEAPHKLAIVEATKRTLERGLYALGIPAPQQM